MSNRWPRTQQMYYKVWSFGNAMSQPAIKFGFRLNTDWQIEIQFAGNRNDYFGGSCSVCLSTSVQLRWYMEMCRFSISCVRQHIYMCMYVDMYVNLRMGLVKPGRARLTKHPKNDRPNSYLRFCNWVAKCLFHTLSRIGYFNSFLWLICTRMRTSLVSAMWHENTIFPIRIVGVCEDPQLFRNLLFRLCQN